MSIYAKLMEIQTKLKAPKGQYNNFGKYSYRNCEDILEALKPLLLEQKCTVVLSDEVVQIGGRYYVKATATLIDTEGEASISNTAYAREEDTKKGMDGSQITGASSSYARKYALNGLFGIDDTKDSDTTNAGNEGGTKSQANNSKPQKITGKEAAEIKSLATEVGSDLDQICSDYKVSKLTELTPRQYEHCMGVLKKKLEK